MCGKRLTFMYNSPYDHVQYNVSDPYVKYFFLQQMYIFTTIFVFKSLKGLVRIMLAQRRRRWPSITSALGQCIVLSGVSGSGMGSITSIM